MRFSIQLLCKAPVPGFAKTRLIPKLGLSGVAALQTNLIRRAVATAVQADIGPVTVWCAPDTSHAVFSELAANYPIRFEAQCSGDLGARMLIAAERALREADAVILIGCDCPVMTPEYIRLGATSLATNDCVLGPAEDGGYVLLGLKEALPPLFEGISWGTDAVLRQTVSRLNALKKRYHFLSTLWDVDTNEDYSRWITHTAERASGSVRVD